VRSCTRAARPPAAPAAPPRQKTQRLRIDALDQSNRRCQRATAGRLQANDRTASVRGLRSPWYLATAVDDPNAVEHVRSAAPTAQRPHGASSPRSTSASAWGDGPASRSSRCRACRCAAAGVDSSWRGRRVPSMRIAPGPGPGPADLAGTCGGGRGLRRCLGCTIGSPQTIRQAVQNLLTTRWSGRQWPAGARTLIDGHGQDLLVDGAGDIAPRGVGLGGARAGP